MLSGISNKLALLLVSALLVSCGAINSKGSSAGGSFGGALKSTRDDKVPSNPSESRRSSETVPVVRNAAEARRANDGPLKITDLLKGVNDSADIRVNKFIWEASLETLSFLPLEAADPFSGVIVMGWGRAPGSSTAFRATILIQDPALEAGSLKVAMQKRNGPASAETNRRIEDAILTRARQLRIRGAKRRQ